MPRVALLTGLEKSPPSGDTAPTILTLDTDAALALGVTQALGTAGTLVERGKPAVCSVQYAVCSVQCAVCSVQYTLYLAPRYAGYPESAGISAKRPEISLRASAQREVESAIIDTL